MDTLLVIGTRGRAHLTAAQIVEHNNWVWTNIAAPAGRAIRMCTVQRALAA
jgi:hypothetical protein